MANWTTKVTLGDGKKIKVTGSTREEVLRELKKSLETIKKQPSNIEK